MSSMVGGHPRILTASFHTFTTSSSYPSRTSSIPTASNEQFPRNAVLLSAANCSIPSAFAPATSAEGQFSARQHLALGKPLCQRFHTARTGGTVVDG